MVTARRAENAESARARAATAKRRLRLDLDAIIDVTLGIVDAEGVDAVSMRRVAAEFDTGPASLYGHVTNKDALLRMVFDRVTQEVSVPADGPWQTVLRAWATDQRQVLARHQDLAKISFAHVPTGENMVETLEVLLRTMIEGSVPAQVAAWAVDALALYVTADVYEGYLLGTVYHDESGRPSEELGLEAFQEVGAYFSSLDPQRFPYVTANVMQMMTGGSEDRFEFGLTTFIAGIEHQAERAAAASSRRRGRRS